MSGILQVRAGYAANAPAVVLDTKTQWKGRIPAGMESPSVWASLANELVDHELYFGAVAAGSRMLLYFGDPESREIAYRTIVRATRGGYPLFVHDFFREGEIQPKVQDSFSDAYYTYKGIINENDGITRWADSYFKKIESEKVPEFQFHEGIKAYQAKNLDKAIEVFNKLLNVESEAVNRSFRIRVARTLARLYFEKEMYEKSLDIYDSFLLKINPGIRQTGWKPPGIYFI